MNLQALTFAVRPRSPWEAMDVAVRLAVTHWRLLLASWLVCVLPIFLIVNILLLQAHPYWVFFILWFLKPLYDRVPLFVLSRVIFSEKTSYKDVISAIPSFFKTGIFSALTLYRLDPGRAFSLPVSQLEGLKGKRRRERMKSLRRNANNREVMLFVLCFHLESLVSWGLIGIVLMMLPVDIAIQSAGNLFTEEPSLLANALSMALYFMVMMVVETLYVAGGFILYLNRRIILEGWDIELVFRKLAQRASQSKLKPIAENKTTIGSRNQSLLAIFMTSLLLLGNVFWSDPVYANTLNMETASASYRKILPPIAQPKLAAEASKETIQAVLADPVFNRMKQLESLKYTGENKKDEDGLDIESGALVRLFESIGQTLAFIFEAGLWLLALIFIFLLVKYRDRLQIGLGRLFKAKEKPAELPEMLFGLDLREESLPDDVVAQALQLYQAQEYRASMALLYRASLAYLVKNYEFSLPNGATEGDCLDLVTKKLALPSEAEGNYFVTLTRAWQQIAYAHRNISEQEFQALCDNWSLYYSQDEASDSRRKGSDDE